MRLVHKFRADQGMLEVRAGPKARGLSGKPRRYQEQQRRLSGGQVCHRVRGTCRRVYRESWWREGWHIGQRLGVSFKCSHEPQYHWPLIQPFRPAIPTSGLCSVPATKSSEEAQPKPACTVRRDRLQVHKSINQC
ncbi:hypothetical protein Agabi119p4_8517 [Agaricus bisporus var. burnettii]|uniref:Uncharacterized protein n=1 Tax=Agaricus bisporus var. burnettii TaxID=192524 RepID=A0A8H7EYK9_AGABI|nr:hypothetical protein Agabi119p4_8517 [Agaricus bisporus var. burnettii]